MTESDQDEREEKGGLGDWIWARWRWLVAAFVLLFVINNIAGLLAGSLGLIAFANRFAGRLLSAQKVVQKVQEIVSDHEDRGD